jgi:hypothetical protein
VPASMKIELEGGEERIAFFGAYNDEIPKRLS